MDICVDTTPSLTVNNAFGYNVKSEVTSATMANGESIYDYDSIGNRLFAALDAATNSYTANALNQYSAITDPVNTVNPVYDLDGNIITNGVWSFRWDAENRMVAAYSNDTLLGVNVYDDQSRRIRKVTAQGTRTFLYDGWNPIREIRSQSSEVSTNYYCWGTDLSGTMQGAGGVGGLFSVIVDGATPATYYPCYDANGNITEYVDELGIVRAEYTFDAFGQTISQSGDMATTFSHRFSTKYADDETGLYYYGYRFYAPGLGRWVSRDPIEEEDQQNLYQAFSNNPITILDTLGLWGFDVHYTKTKILAKRLYSKKAAEAIAMADEGVDHGSTSFMPVFGDQRYHFDMNKGRGLDTRLERYEHHLVAAKWACNWKIFKHDDPEKAAKEMGTALHPLQDWVAHGEYGRYDEGGIYTVHNEYSPQSKTWGAVTDYPDDPSLDAKNGPDGRAAGLAMQNVTVNIGVSVRLYAVYERGTKRIRLTEKKTLKALSDFRKYLKENAGCECKQYFGIK